MPDLKHQILIVEDAVGVALLYEKVLSDDYEITVCHSGVEVQALIEQSKKFDLTIMDILLPPEDMKKFSLEDCQKTGLRLMEAMIRNGTCSRFYVVTGMKDLRSEVERICQSAGIIYEFHYKLDSEPDELNDNVKVLLKQEPA